jgi:hypothetical protein
MRPARHPGMTDGLTALSLAVYAIPLVLAAYLFIKQAIKAPIRTWMHLLFFIAVILLAHGVANSSALTDGRAHLHSGRR